MELVIGMTVRYINKKNREKIGVIETDLNEKKYVVLTNGKKVKRDKIIYYVESNYFHFLTLNRDRDTLEKRYCHHDEANLEIEELEYLGLE